MSAEADSAQSDESGRGFMLGELLVAVFLLVVAISSVTALMYSATRHPRARAAEECTEKGSAGSAKCAVPAKASTAKPKGAAKLLLAGCATRSGAEVKECRDSVAAFNAPGAMTLRSRTDSASLELLPKKPRRTTRTDLGFVR
ncbi:MAG: hypothetical protein M3365_11340 [Gemmatimonadota bacterium]|nr:hypothetical protein [Gemmatimonadota bacterium]